MIAYGASAADLGRDRRIKQKFEARGCEAPAVPPNRQALPPTVSRHRGRGRREKKVLDANRSPLFQNEASVVTLTHCSGFSQ